MEGQRKCGMADADKTHSLFHVVMGDKVELRWEFIERPCD